MPPIGPGCVGPTGDPTHCPAARLGTIAPRLPRRVGQEREMPRTLDGARQDTLMLGASARLATRYDAPTAARSKLAQQVDVFVIHCLDFVGAELAHTSPPRSTAGPTTASAETTPAALATTFLLLGRVAPIRIPRIAGIIICHEQCLPHQAQRGLLMISVRAAAQATSSRRTTRWRMTSSVSLSRRSSSSRPARSILAWSNRYVPSV